MPYYQAGDYYQAGAYYKGDYYQAGGLFGSIGKALGGVARAVIGATPVGAVASALIPSFNRPQIAGIAPGMIVPTPGLKGFGQRLIPGGKSGFELARRRRMNPLNVRALRRAGRRVKGFLRVARRLGALPVAGGKGKRLFKARRRK